MKIAKKTLSVIMAVLMVLSCWVWTAPSKTAVANAAEATDHYLFAYFTGTSKEGQTIHMAVSDDGYNYTALRNNEPVIIPSKGVGNVRDPYIWYNKQDNYYYILATDLDFTDGGGDYSNNSQSFIIWRSKDLVNWYDETMIDVSKMAHLIGDTRNMSAVWAPQVLWDGSAYVVYFTLACNATSWFDIVYLKTTDLMDPNAYYEFDYILGNGTGNGVDNGYGVIDADIIHNPGDGKYYLFYKTECNGHEMGSTATGTSLKTIHYYVGDTPTGPFRNPGDTKWSNAGFSIFPNYNVSLEGCNSFFDNDGNLIMYVDEFEHKNALSGEAEAYFHIAKSNGNDFTSWSYPDVSKHNINSLSPRHGSVVKITATEYQRLLNNSYNVSSSSYSETETLKDHLVARYFTTSDVLWNDVIGQPNLATSTGITMVQDPETKEWYAKFDTTNGGWAEVDFDSLFRKTNGLNYDDGFTITFSARCYPMSNNNSENNDRIYEIADVFGSRTGTEHYTHYSPGGGGNGSYLGNYNGPVDSGNDWLNDKDRANRDDGKLHDYIISYANGNVMVYIDGELVISRNRFTGVKLDESWYEALGSNATMRIGRSGWDADPLFKGNIKDLCIYDCSMSYYDAMSLEGEGKEEIGWVENKIYNGITSKVPTFASSNASQMESLRGTSFSNILYVDSPNNEPYQNQMNADNTAAYWNNNNDVNYGMFYAKTTVLLVDGIKSAIMPVMFGEECDNNCFGNTERKKYVYSVFPTESYPDYTDSTNFYITQPWGGWYRDPKYHEVIQAPDSHIGIKHNDQSNIAEFNPHKNNTAYWAAPLRVNEDTIDFGDQYYKCFNLSWYVQGGKTSSWNPVHTTNDSHCGAMYSDHDIYVIDFRPVLKLRNSITKADYDAIMNNEQLCDELRQRYAYAVYTIKTLDPNNYSFDEAPVTATKALGKAIGEAVGTYEGVMAEIEREKAAGFYGHQCSEFAAREATCTQNGLTAGSYCTICGEIVKEQEVLAPLPHKFGDIFTEDGIKYKQCSVCGVKIEYQPSSVRYENLFSLNGWDNSASKNVFEGTVNTNLTDGTITIVNKKTYTGDPGKDEIYTRGHYDGQNLASTRDFGNCCIPVKGGQTYVVEATSLASSTSHGEVFIFQYNKDGLVFSAIPTVLGLNPGQTAHNEFTVDKNAAYIELRFDCNDAGKTITYSQIGVYTKDSAEKFANDTADARLGYNPGDDKDLCYPNPGDGYSFAGWYTKSGIKIDNVNQLNNPTVIVYGKWIAAGYNVVYDSIFSFSDWAKSSCNQLYYRDDNSTGTLQRLVTTEGIVTDASKGTITITNDEETNNFARTNYWVDNGNVYKSKLDQNTEYILEYTVTSEDGGKPNVCLYITGGTDQYPETGNFTRYSTGTHYFRFDSGDNTSLTLRFDNVQHGSTVTFSNIAVYKADFEEAARTITNREYMRYYPTKMGIGDVFEYTPTRPGFTFSTWKADTNGDMVGDFEMKGFDDTFLVEQNWHLFSEWTENSYNIVYKENGGTGSQTTNTLYTADVKLADSGFTKVGYKLIGWSTDPNATTALYQPGQTTNRLVGENNGTITLYAVWQAKLINVTFDNLIDFSAWNKSAGNGTVSDVTDTGFTITCNDGAGEATSSSPFFPVKPGYQYKIEMDFIGDNWDVYIFFCNANGAWVDFADGPTNRYSSNGSTGIDKDNAVFTAPNKAEVVKAQIRVDSNGSNNTVRFEDIRVYEVGTVASEVSYHLKQVIGYDSNYSLPTPTKYGYEFLGWFDENGNRIETTGTMKVENDLNLKSRWAISTVVVDFDSPVTIEPFAPSLTTSDYTINSISTNNGTFGTFALKDNKITYTPENSKGAINDVDTTTYSFNSPTGKATTLNIVPGSNVLYGEDNFTQANTNYMDWTVDQNTNVSAISQTAYNKNDVYGYDVNYFNDGYTYSDGTALSVTLDDTNKNNKRSEILSFTFTGTGFQLYGDCNYDTGVQLITLKNNTNGKMVKSYVVDTYYGDTTYGALHQVPLVTENGLEPGSYTVQVCATYVSFAEALNNPAPVMTYGLRGGFGAPVVSTAELFYEHLVEIGMEEIFEADDMEFILFDEKSMFNSGFGAVTYAMADETETVSETEARTVSGLVNIIDGIRVFTDTASFDRYYKATEQNATYYNVIDNLVNSDENNVIQGREQLFAYVVGNSEWEINTEDYDPKGPKDEIYLANTEKSGIAFSVDGLDTEHQRVMVSLRAASGTPTAKFGEKMSEIPCNTEMYYDITDFVAEDGTITIQNNGDGLLAIGYVKVTGHLPVMATFNMRSARMMMMAPAQDVELNAPAEEPEPIIPDEPIAPEEPSTEETTTEETTTEDVTTEEPTTEETTTEEVTTEEPTTEETTTEAPSTEEPTTPDADEDNSEETKESFIDKINGLIDFIVSLIKKIFSSINFIQNL